MLDENLHVPDPALLARESAGAAEHRLEQDKDPENRPDKDYPISWIRQYGKGRVFYCSLGHVSGPYCSPVVLQHYLAGISSPSAIYRPTRHGCQEVMEGR